MLTIFMVESYVAAGHCGEFKEFYYPDFPEGGMNLHHYGFEVADYSKYIYLKLVVNITRATNKQQDK